ncbi:MAG: sodium-dependent transporter [Candidatus Thermoplasmatota archaeon]|nr:sodium-dependent transporter [Candidatus Thermoplasmatota archaeon]MBS3802406.1 sodium-dependent transporter [Candidatus Thermoplasmatota archaeon]
MEKWSSKFGFILAAIGSAVGIGNIWRFSSVVGQNGGGAYLIPYLIAVFLFALPLMILELVVGRHLQGNVVSSFGKIKTQFRIFGWAICAIVFVVLSYYLVITGWTLGYLVSSLSNSGTTFSDFTSSYQPLVYFVIGTLLTGFIISFGVKKGIQRISTILMPFSFLLLIILAIFCMTLSGFGEGIDFLFTPDFSVLSNPMIWSAAFGQAFFSLSVGFGVLLTYGGYLEKNTNIVHSSLIITVADISVAFLAGLIIFPIVFTFNLAPGMGAELAFSTLPLAFSLLAYGQVLAVAFFLLLFFAALTSSIGMLEVSVAAVMEKTSFSRRKTSFLLTLLLLLVGLPAALSYTSMNLSFFGVRILDLLDETLGTIGLPITALLTTLVFTWFLQKKVFTEELLDSKWWTKLVLYMTKYVIPIVLLITTVSQLVLNIDFAGWSLVRNVQLLRGAVSGMLGLVLLGGALGILLFIERNLHRYK